MDKKLDKKILATNSKALFNYTVVDKIEGGLKLFGYEVKAVRQGLASMTGSYVIISPAMQVSLLNLHIPKYEKASTLKEYLPTRPRAVLLNKREILKTKNYMTQKGLTLIPLSLYSKGAFIKVELGLCRGKKKADKKAVLKQRDIDRDTERFLKFE